MSWKRWALIGGALLLVGFCIGRLTVSEESQRESETYVASEDSESDQSTRELARNQHKETVRTEIVRADKSREITTQIITDTRSDSSERMDILRAREESEKQSTKEQIVRSGGGFSISALAGVAGISRGVGLDSVIYGGHISKSIFGPLTGGIWGLNNLTGGLSVGISF